MSIVNVTNNRDLKRKDTGGNSGEQDGKKFPLKNP